MIKSTTRFIALAALFLIPLFPLIAPYPLFFPLNVAGSFFFPFITGKGFYFRILVEIAFASWIILAFLDARYRPRINAMTIAVTVFALVALVADLLGVNPTRSFWSNFERMEGWITIFHLWMFYMVASNMFSSDWRNKNATNEEGKSWWRSWMNTFVGFGVIVAIYAFVQFFGGAAIHQGSRIDASLGNAAYLAVYMLMCCGMATYLYFEARRRHPKMYGLQIMYGVLALVFAFLLIQTATRGTILGLIGGIMLALFIYAVLAKNESKRSRIIAGSFIGLIVLVGIVFWMNRSAEFIQKNEVLQRMANISLKDTKTQARGYIWPMAITGWSQRPILGWGQENFNYVFNANYEPRMWTQEQWFDRAHNVFLDWLIAAGIIGLMAYLSLYVLALYMIWKSDLTISEKSALTGLVAAYAVHNIFVFDNLASYVGFFALLSFFGSSLTRSHSKKQVTTPVLAGSKEVGIDMIEYVVAPVAIIALVVVLYVFNVRAINANTTLIRALQACNTSTPDAALFSKVLSLKTYVADQETREQVISCASNIANNQQVPNPTKQAMLIEANKAIEDQIAFAPKDARMYVLGGQFLGSLGQTELALPILERAHVLTPGKQGVNFELANTYINTGKLEDALTLLKEAYEADVTYPQAQSAYAMGLVLVGREEEARKIFKDDPAIFETERMAQVYSAPVIKKYDKAIAIYKKLIEKSPTDINLRTNLARVQFAGGYIGDTVVTLRAIAKDRPELADQIDAAIKSIQQ